MEQRQRRMGLCCWSLPRRAAASPTLWGVGQRLKPVHSMRPLSCLPGRPSPIISSAPAGFPYIGPSGKNLAGAHTYIHTYTYRQTDSALHCTTLHYITLHCIALHCKLHKCMHAFIHLIRTYVHVCITVYNVNKYIFF